jgi:hypothetical protein
MVGFISLVLTMFCTFLLVRTLSGSYWVGVIAGALFAFNPYRWGHFSHLQLLPVFWTPLALLFAHKFLKDLKALNFALTLVFTCGQYYASMYLGTHLLALLMVQFAIHIILERKGRDRWVFFTDLRLRKMMLAGLCGGILILLPLGYPYLQTLYTWDAHRPLFANTYFSAEPLSYLSPSNFLNYDWLSTQPSIFLPAGEGRLFFGLMPWILSLAGLWLAISPRREISTEKAVIIKRYAWTAFVMFILSLGPYLKWHGQSTDIPLPYQLFYNYFPGFQGMRVPARFAQPLLLCMLVMGGLALACWSKKWIALKLWIKVGLAVFVSCFVIWENAIRINFFPVEMRFHPFPAYYYLSQTHPQKPVLELPLDYGQAEYEFLINQTLHWRPLMGGVSGWMPPGFDALHDYVTHCPSKACFSNLEHIPFQTLLVHLKYFTPQQTQRWLKADLKPLGLKLIGNMDNVLVWERTELEPPSSKIKITDFFLFTVDEPSLLFSDKKKLSGYFFVQPASSSKPWHYLKKGYGPVEVTLTKKDGQSIKSTVETPFPPYLMPGETSALSFNMGYGEIQDFASIEIGGPLIENFKTPGQAVKIFNASQTSLNPESGLLAQAEQWNIPNSEPLRTGQFILVEAKVHNRGTAYWLDKKYVEQQYSQVKGRVKFSTTWIYQQKGQTCDNLIPVPKLVKRDKGDIAHIIGPGQSSRIQEYVQAPMQPGKYFLVIEMISDSVTTFNRVGPSFSKCAEFTIMPR